MPGTGTVVTCPSCNRSVRAYAPEVQHELDKQYHRLEQRHRVLTEAALRELWRNGTPELVAVVEDVRSLWNVGSIFRSADGAGVRTLFLCGATGTPPRKEIAKTSLGAEDAIDWLYARNATDVLPLLKQNGVMLIALERTRGRADVADSIPLTAALNQGLIEMPAALVLGNEVHGVSPQALSYCDLICDLPMRGMKESLNVAVAFGIAAYACGEKLR